MSRRKKAGKASFGTALAVLAVALSIAPQSGHAGEIGSAPSDTSQAIARDPVMPTAITTGVVVRNSDKTDSHGLYLPPWTETTVEPFALPKQPNIGDAVTIVPFVADAQPFELDVTDVLEAMGCTDEAAGWHPVLAPVERQEIREYEVQDPNRNPEFPFEVAVFYPKVPQATLLPRQSLRLDHIPNGVARHTVQGAVDFNGNAEDGPNVVFVERCCARPENPLDQCDYICGETYWRDDEVWRLYDSYRPC